MRAEWNRFFFAPISTASLGLYRIAFSAVTLFYALLLFPDRFTWFSQHGMFTREAADNITSMETPGPHLNLFHFGVNDQTLTLFFVVFILATIFLMLGLWTRSAAFIVWVCLNSLHNRDGSILNSGDTMMIVMALYLIVAPAGAACSLDRLWRIAKGREGDEPPRLMPWVQRIMQIQVNIVYLCSALFKFAGVDWINGTAAYYPLHMPEMARFPVPFMDGRWGLPINLLTYGTLLIELSLATLVWVPRLRLYVLAAGVLLHLGIEYSLNIPLFSFLMITSYIVFLRESDLKNFISWMQEPLGKTSLRLVYDGECEFCKSALLAVRFLDVFRLITFLDYHDPAQLAQASGVRFQDADNAAIAVDQRGRQMPGFYAFRALAWRLPWTWIVAPFLYIPGIPWLGRRVYAWVVVNRSRLPVAPRYASSSAPAAKDKEQVGV